MATNHRKIAGSDEGHGNTEKLIMHLNFLFLMIEEAAGTNADLNAAFLLAQIGVELTNVAEVGVNHAGQ